MSGDLFTRVFSLNIQGRNMDNLDVEFRVERSLTTSQNTAEVRVFNLSADTRKFLASRTKGAIVELRAGYAPKPPTVLRTQNSRRDREEDQLTEVPRADLDSDLREGLSAPAPPLPRLLLSELRIVRSLRDGADWVTEVSTGDADSVKKHPVSFSLGAGTDLREAIKRTVQELGVGVGNMVNAMRGKPPKSLPNGVTVHGHGDKDLGRMLGEYNLEHSWQDGELQVVEKGGGVAATAVTLSEETGLVGSPEVGDTGSVKARSLLNPEIYPGRIVHLISQNTSGFFVAQKVVHLGASAGEDWFTDLELRIRK